MINKYLSFIKDAEGIRELVWGIFIFVLSLTLTYFSVAYANIYANGNVVPDLILDHLPTFDVSFMFFQGGIVFIILTALIVMFEPKNISFVLKSTALFFSVRAIFTILTHLSAPELASYTYMQHEQGFKEALFTISSGNDLFFSGHAGYPFFLALIFWKHKLVRYFFLISSLAGAMVVLMGHLHYSIDVFSAYFIGFGLFELAKILFRRDHERFV